jgi:hypothetical protein
MSDEQGPEAEAPEAEAPEAEAPEAEAPEAEAPEAVGPPLPPGMAVLVSVPFEIAKRLESFLLAHGVVCELRKREPDQPAGPTTPGRKPSTPEPYDSGMRQAARNLLKVRSTPPKLPDLAMEKDPRPLYEVLVREEDLALAGTDTEGAVPEQLEMIEGVAGEMVVLCRLPWHEAWALAGRLTEGGVPAVAVPDTGEDREVALEQRVIPVAVRPEDLEAARAAIAT